MSCLIKDLLGHQAWADAEHWRAVRSHPVACADEVIRKRLQHIHQVQRMFVWAVGDRGSNLEFTKPDDFETFEQLQVFARGSHTLIDQLLSTLLEARLEERVTFSWFKDPPLTISVSEALAQCAMHSQWHRGQNAARLRELGGEPPMVDLIVWFWKGRPAVQW